MLMRRRGWKPMLMRRGQKLTTRRRRAKPDMEKEWKPMRRRREDGS
jgi:hypothetical protein